MPDLSCDSTAAGYVEAVLALPQRQRQAMANLASTDRTGFAETSRSTGDPAVVAPRHAEPLASTRPRPNADAAGWRYRSAGDPAIAAAGDAALSAATAPPPATSKQRWPSRSGSVRPTSPRAMANPGFDGPDWVRQSGNGHSAAPATRRSLLLVIPHLDCDSTATGYVEAAVAVPQRQRQAIIALAIGTSMRWDGRFRAVAAVRSEQRVCW
jgi:hypothetical protein